MTGHRFPVEAGHLLMFNRAIGEVDPPDGAQPPVAPTFTIAAAHYDPEYPLRPRPGAPWIGSASAPSQQTATAEPGGSKPSDGAAGGPALHAEQHFEYHAPIEPGGVLWFTTRPGRQWTKTGRQGLLAFAEHLTEYRDGEGRLVVTARGVTVRVSPAGAE